MRQQTSIERVHGMALLHNEDNETLDADEEHLLNEVRDRDSGCRLVPTNPPPPFPQTRSPTRSAACATAAKT